MTNSEIFFVLLAALGMILLLKKRLNKDKILGFFIEENDDGRN
jgi:hypothetical protein